MTPLGKEKADEAKFKITGKFTGGVGASGKWTPDSKTKLGGNRFGNDWEAEARYNANDKPQPSMYERLRSAKTKADLGAGPAKLTVNIPGKTDSVKSKVKAKVTEAVSKKTKKATSILSPRARSEKSRLEGLFSGGISHPAQLIPAVHAAKGMAGIVDKILKRIKE